MFFGHKYFFSQLCAALRCRRAAHCCGFSRRAAQRAKIAEKVHKPPLVVNVINFELNGFNASLWVPWSPSESKKVYSNDRSIQILKISVFTT